MNTISLKVSDALAAELATAASRRGVSKSELVRAAIRALLREDEGIRRGSSLSPVSHLVGAFSGPADLSVNKQYLEGLGE